MTCFYTKTYPCSCGGKMDRLPGDNFYKYIHKCEKCGKELRGTQFNLEILEIEETEDGKIYLIEQNEGYKIKMELKPPFKE